MFALSADTNSGITEGSHPELLGSPCGEHHLRAGDMGKCGQGEVQWGWQGGSCLGQDTARQGQKRGCGKAVRQHWDKKCLMRKQSSGLANGIGPKLEWTAGEMKVAHGGNSSSPGLCSDS